MNAAIELGRAALERLVGIQFVDRAVALGSLAFTALVPLLVIAGAFVPGADGLADGLIERFDLSGSSAALVREAFAQPDAVRQSVSWLSVLLLIVSSLSFTRALQRVYEQAWRLPARGVRGTRAGLAWLGGIVLWTSVFASARDALVDVSGPIVTLAILLAGNGLLWLWSPFVLLGARVPWRPLLPTAALTSAAMTLFGIGSAIWMPGTIERSADAYGPIGIAIALVSWLVGAGFALTVSAAVGAVLGERQRAV